MDAGLMIKDLAALIGVTQATVINWKVRGVSPTSGKLEKVEMVVAQLGSYRITNE